MHFNVSLPYHIWKAVSSHGQSFYGCFVLYKLCIQSPLLFMWILACLLKEDFLENYFLHGTVGRKFASVDDESYFFLFIWKGSQWIVVVHVVVGLCTIFFLVCWVSILWVVGSLVLCRFTTWQATFPVLLKLLLQSVQGNTGCNWRGSYFATHLSVFEL